MAGRERERKNQILTSTGSGAVIPPRCANGVPVPTDIDGDRCILFCTRLTVNMTGDLSGEMSMRRATKKKTQL